MAKLIGTLFAGASALGVLTAGLLGLGLWPLAGLVVVLLVVVLVCLGLLVPIATYREISSPSDPDRLET